MGHFRYSTNYRTQKDNLSKPRPVVPSAGLADEVDLVDTGFAL